VNFDTIIAEKLLQIKAIKLSPHNPFIWTSGIKSPIYCDNRLSLSFPEIRNIIMDGFLNKIESIPNVNCIGAVATAGIPYGAILSHVSGLPFVYVRDKPKAHGRQNQIEGQLPENSKVILIEDLISTGKSSIAAALALREAGAEILCVMSIFNYGMKFAESQFAENDLKFESLSNYDVLLEVALKSNYIQAEQLQILQQWKNDPMNYPFDNI
jgi:orotate phosphoribosyltransferase